MSIRKKLFLLKQQDFKIFIIIIIKDLLGHESITTTEEYAKVLEKDKFKAIENASPEHSNIFLDDWNDDKDLLNQLINL